jgi:hypothetical protein
METFAPAYFDYMSSSFTAGVCLLPITLSLFSLPTLESASDPSRQDLRVFQGYLEDYVTLRTRETQNLPDESRRYGKPALRSQIFEGESDSLFGLQIGNIWLKHDRACFLGKIYDLKGSTRGRHVQSTGRENEVLLDENLNESEIFGV